MENKGIYVVRFDKNKFDITMLGASTDEEKYKTALSYIGKGSVIFTSKEFEDKLNKQLPMDRYMQSYIVCVSDKFVEELNKKMTY